MKQLRKLFGRKKTTVIPIHHQWLYGRSAPAMLWNILNVTNPETMGTGNPFHPETYMLDGVDGFINKLMAMIQVNTCPLSPRGIAFEGMHFLLDEDDVDMREDFTLGDNNDGVLIIDAIERKYCFINIFIYKELYSQMDATSIYFAPSMTPLSAREYMKCYYPEVLSRIDSDTPKKQKVENIALNLEMDKLINDSFEPSVLTLKEVKKIFPKVFKKVLA
jgi:hypothetical protein